MSAPARPFISVVVPTYRRPRALAACLAALVEQQYPRERYEVIVVDDGGGTPADAVAQAAHAGLAVRLRRVPHGGPGPARNAGAARARGELLAFTDDDCRPTPGWLAAFASEFARAPAALLGGRTLNALPHNRCSTASQALIAYLYAAAQVYPGVPRFFASNNLALAAALFHRVGGFDLTWPLAAGEDRDFCDRWQHAGRSLVYAPTAMVYHAHALGLRGYLRQHFGYGRGAYYFHRARARRQRRAVALAPPHFYVNLLRYPFVSGRPHARQLAALLALSQAAHLAGFVCEVVRPTARTGARAGRAPAELAEKHR